MGTILTNSFDTFSSSKVGGESASYEQALPARERQYIAKRGKLVLLRDYADDFLKIGDSLFIEALKARMMHAGFSADESQKAAYECTLCINLLCLSVFGLEKGVITSDYGRRGDRTHYGIDIAPLAKGGVAQVPLALFEANGRLLNDKNGYGTYLDNVRIQLFDGLFGFKVLLAHLERAGEYVQVGSTGRSTGTHLHIEVKAVIKGLR